MNRLANPSDTGRCFWRRNRRSAGWRIMSVSGDGQTVFCVPVKRVKKEIQRAPAGEPVTFPASAVDWSNMTWPAETQETE